MQKLRGFKRFLLFLAAPIPPNNWSCPQGPGPDFHQAVLCQGTNGRTDHPGCDGGAAVRSKQMGCSAVNAGQSIQQSPANEEAGRAIGTVLVADIPRPNMYCCNSSGSRAIDQWARQAILLAKVRHVREERDSTVCH
jgi:hypothetical protein